MNLLAEVVQVPALGCYTRLNTGCYEASGSVGKSGIDETGLTKVSDDPEACDTHVIAPNDEGEIERVALKIPANAPYYHINDSTTCDGWNGVIDAETDEILSVDPKEFGIADGARPERTTYDRDVFGYYFYWKPTAMGYWWDKWMAIKALSDPYTDFIGVDSSSDQASYAISLSTLFAEDINNLVGGLIIERPDLYAGRLDADGKYEPLKAIGLYANDTVDRPTSDSVWVDPDQQYTLQLIGMMNVAYQAWNIDGFDFANSMNIGIHYDPSQIVPDDVRNDPTRYIELTEPATGLKFFSVNNERYLDQAEERPFLSVGFQYISDVKNRLYEGGAAGPGTDVLEGYYGWQVEGDTRVMRIMSASSDLFGGAGVWSGDIQF
jgi:hypothetical protein